MKRRALLGVWSSMVVAGCGSFAGSSSNSIAVEASAGPPDDPPQIEDYQYLPAESEEPPIQLHAAVDECEETTTLDLTAMNESGKQWVSVGPDYWDLWRLADDEQWVNLRSSMYITKSDDIPPQNSYTWEVNVVPSNGETPYSGQEAPKRDLSPPDAPEVRIESLPLTTGQYLFTIKRARFEETNYILSFTFEVM